MELHYDTVINAINSLKDRGYIVDFSLDGDCIVVGSERISANDFSIVDVYRYEGDSDPSEEAAVYAIESTSGLKGVLVAAYGATSDELTDEMLQKLKVR